MRRQRGLLPMFLTLLAFGCVSSQRAAAPRETTPSYASTVTYEGRASYYARSLHGRTTASGEIYDENALTAAHRTLEFGTRVRITNLSNGRSVIVRINDRGPHVEGRVIDLSYRAAQQIDFIDAGVTMVRLEVLE